MVVAPNDLLMERPHDKEQNQADVPEGGRLSVTCIAKGAKPQAYIYWNSEPELSKVSKKKMLVCSNSSVEQWDKMKQNKNDFWQNNCQNFPKNKK